MKDIELTPNSFEIKEEISIDNLRKEIFDSFNKSEQRNLNYQEATINENDEIARWLVQNRLYFKYKAHYNKLNIFLNETDKKECYSQSYCQICGRHTISLFSIRIKPKSRQVKTKIKSKFKKDFSKSRQRDLGLLKKDRLCIKIIFILKTQRDKDLDNMAKLTLDSLKELIQIDDMNIDHLELIKLKTKYLESFISFRISKSEINSKDNVILKGTNLVWKGEDKLD